MLDKQQRNILLIILMMIGIGFFGGHFKETNPPAQQQTAQDYKNENANSESGKSFWQRTTEDPVAYFTLWLVAFTGVLAVVSIVQGWFLLRSEGIAKTSADAAKKSAEAVITAERARLFVDVDLGENPVAASNGAKNTINVSLWNYGKTVARIRMIRAYSVIADDVQTELIEHERSDKRLPDGLGLAPSYETPFHVPVFESLRNDDWGAIQRLEKRWSIVGKIVYYDIFGEERETGFCWYMVWQMNHARFEFDRESKLNYQT